MPYKNRSLEYTPSSKDYLLALDQFPNYLKLLNPEGKSYQKLHTWILEHEELLHGDDKFPSIKEITSELQISSIHLKNYLAAIYDDILKLNESSPELFVVEQQTLCLVYFSHFVNHRYFYLGLNAIPRIKEIFEFYFIKPIVGSGFFTVRSISHAVGEKGHMIMIYLDTEPTYDYLELLIEKAYLNGHISFYEYFERPIGDELKEKLIKRTKSL